MFISSQAHLAAVIVPLSPSEFTKQTLNRKQSTPPEGTFNFRRQFYF